MGGGSWCFPTTIPDPEDCHEEAYSFSVTCFFFPQALVHIPAEPHSNKIWDLTIVITATLWRLWPFLSTEQRCQHPCHSQYRVTASRHGSVSKHGLGRGFCALWNKACASFFFIKMHFLSVYNFVFAGVTYFVFSILGLLHWFDHQWQHQLLPNVQACVPASASDDGDQPCSTSRPWRFGTAVFWALSKCFPAHVSDSRAFSYILLV